MVYSRTRPSVSPLHAKGIFTLGFVLISESVTVSNAVKLWSTHSSLGNDHRIRDQNSYFSKNVQECLESTSATETCQAPRSLPPIPRGGALGKLTRRFSFSIGKQRDCCSDCNHCMSVEQSLKQCHKIPRGGYVDKLVDAAASVAEADAVMPYGIPLNGWKVIFQAFLTTLNVVCWLVPLRSKKISENKLALSLANAFSGGVFLSLAFGHLIPECVHGFAAYNEVTPYLLVLSGYLLIFFVEKVAFDAHEILHEMEHAQDNKDAVEANGENKGGTTGRSALILLGALAVHSILEMTALGLADSFGDSAVLTISIALHQVRFFSFEHFHFARDIRNKIYPHLFLALCVYIARGVDSFVGRLFEIWHAKG